MYIYIYTVIIITLLHGYGWFITMISGSILVNVNPVFWSTCGHGTIWKCPTPKQMDGSGSKKLLDSPTNSPKKYGFLFSFPWVLHLKITQPWLRVAWTRLSARHSFRRSHSALPGQYPFLKTEDQSWISYDIWSHSGHSGGLFEKLPLILKFDATLRKLEGGWRIENQENWGLKPRKCDIKPAYPTCFLNEGKKHVTKAAKSENQQHNTKCETKPTKNARWNQQNLGLPWPHQPSTRMHPTDQRNRSWRPHRREKSVSCYVAVRVLKKQPRFLSIPYFSYSFTAKIVSSQTELV